MLSFGRKSKLCSRACACAILLFAANGAAGAQSSPPSEVEISGDWSFQTEWYYDGECQLTGQMSIQRSVTEGRYLCQFTAQEYCKTTDRAIASEQKCVARVVNDALIIDSELVSVDEEAAGAYYPDSFSLRVESPSEMRGVLRSVGPFDPVIFRRVENAIS